MKIITYIYIFALYVVFTPGFLVKTTLNIENYLLYSLLFCIIFFFTIKLVDRDLENYEQQVSLKMNGLNNLVDLVKTRQKNQETNIDIQNQIKGAEDSGSKCWNALGKTQKDMEVLRVQLNSYEGNWETIQKLNETIIEYKDKLATLQTQLGAYQNDKNASNQLLVQLAQYQSQVGSLQKQLATFSGTDADLENVKTEYDSMLNNSKKLIIQLSDCNALIPSKTQDITALNKTISKNNKRIRRLQKKFNLDTQKITKLNEIYNNNNAIIADIGDTQSFNKREYCPKYRYVLNETSESQDWHTKNAKKQGGVLTPIGSQEEQTLVYNVRKNSSANGVWIGGVRQNSNWWDWNGAYNGGEYYWKWLDGTKWDYTNWARREPNNYNEESTVMWKNGQWNDLQSRYKRPAIYKIPNY
tara:strand:- start:638 stop:1876 length:1239 start_codon:yes stop_codon:yes gene_type:complete